ncbi:uncharacterized protein LOC107319127 [Coturnix japonica]|uniref:uncharacterized protein LOC107319127 n=1 Tax=Coturnix japonica TaxID=93934 RepID=UPI0007773DE5|nr:uncharacterized protein LOC107319127 [Coturnix japonica]
MPVSHYFVDLCILMLLFLIYKCITARRQQDDQQRRRWWRWRRRMSESELSGERWAHGPICPTSGSPNPTSTFSKDLLTPDAGVPSSEHMWRTRALPPASPSTGREVSGLPACFPLTAPMGACGDGARDGSCKDIAVPVSDSKLQLEKEVRNKMEFHTARKSLQIKLKCLPGLVLCSMEVLSCSLTSTARSRPVPVYIPRRESSFLPEEQREMLELHIRTAKLQRCKEHHGREQPSQRAVRGQDSSRAALQTNRQAQKFSTWTNTAHTAAGVQHRRHRRGHSFAIRGDD